MNDGKRRRWTAAEKLRIVLAGLQGADVSELCRREGLNPTMYYAWKKKLMSSASAIFEQDTARSTAQEQKSAAQMQRMKDVIAEITAENLQLKKGFWP